MNHVAIYSTVGVIVLCAVLLLGMAPLRVKLNRQGEILKLSTALGFSRSIPVCEIVDARPVEKLPSRLVRVCGYSLGKAHSGIFYSREEKKWCRLFLTGEKPIRQFVWKGKTWYTDSWD